VAELKSRIFDLIKTESFNQDIIVLIFSKSDLNSAIPSIHRLDEKEFIYKGRFYDIVKEEVVGDKVYFHCIHDKTEGFLNFLFVKNFKNHNDECSFQNLLSGPSFKFLPVYLLTKKDILTDYYQCNIIQAIPEIFKRVNFPEIPTPPPQNFNYNII
jgi:hypothetical protein